MSIDPGLRNLIYAIIVDARTGKIVRRMKLTNGEYHEKSGHNRHERRVKKKLKKFVVTDTALSLVTGKTASYDKACAHIKALFTLEVEVEMPDGTTSNANAFNTKRSIMFQPWIANDKFRVYSKQQQIIDSFVSDFRAPNGEKVDLIVYGDASLQPNMKGTDLEIVQHCTKPH